MGIIKEFKKSLKLFWKCFKLFLKDYNGSYQKIQKMFKTFGLPNIFKIMIIGIVILLKYFEMFWEILIFFFHFSIIPYLNPSKKV